MFVSRSSKVYEREVNMLKQYGSAILAFLIISSPLCLGEGNYFRMPSDQEIDPSHISPKDQQSVVAQVGKGGITETEFELSQKQYANLMGLAQVPEGGFAKMEVNLNPQQKANALYNAIDEELLFQAAAAEGLLANDHWKRKIIQEYREMLSALPKVAKEDPHAPVQFESMREADVSEFTEEQIQAYYQEHPSEFMAPSTFKVKFNFYPQEDEGSMGEKSFARARENPEAYEEWQGEESVIEGHIPSCIQDGIQPSRLAPLFITAKGSVSPTIHGNVQKYVFWVVDKEESAGLRPLEEVRQKVLYRLARGRFEALAQIQQNEPGRFYTMALNEGVHRKLKSQIAFQYLNGRKRDEVLAELRKKYEVKVLLTDPIYLADKRNESRRDFISNEEKAMEDMMRSPRFSAPPNPDAPQAETSPTNWKDILSWAIWPVLIVGGLIAVWKFKNS